MRHSNNVRKFGRDKNQRKALLAGLALSLIRRERISTTLAKAKDLRPFLEKLVTKAKKGTVSVKKDLEATFSNNKAVVKKLVDVIAPKYSDRTGGYTRVLKLPERKSDAAPQAVIEFV